jgi:enterochelin esterase-like enzyme
MKKISFLIGSILLATIMLGQGKTLESLSLKSSILGREVRYSIYLPAGYETAQRRYPTLYLLHGNTDDETGWTQFGEVNTIANEALAKPDCTPMIIAMPDAAATWYINDFASKARYEDFFIKEFIPYIDSVYKTRSSKRYRAVAGLSMGGFGSLIYALKYPELFAACVPLSAAVFTEEEFLSFNNERWISSKFDEVYGKYVDGKSRLTAHYYQNSILKLAATVPTAKLNTVRFYIDCGDKDFLIKGNMALHSLLIDQKIKHEFRVREGVHNWTYWRTALPEVLKFVSEAFHQ